MAELRLGVAGYCSKNFDECEALSLVRQAYNEVVRDFPAREIIVVSGLTNVGVLALAYTKAKTRAWKTRGIVCKKAYDFKSNWFPVDEEPIVVGENWGDESETFVNSIDALIRIGGGPQSRREAEQAKS